jgi:hypothetical protein
MGLKMKETSCCCCLPSISISPAEWVCLVFKNYKSFSLISLLTFSLLFSFLPSFMKKTHTGTGKRCIKSRSEGRSLIHFFKDQISNEFLISCKHQIRTSLLYSSLWVTGYVQYKKAWHITVSSLVIMPLKWEKSCSLLNDLSFCFILSEREVFLYSERSLFLHQPK